MAAKKHTPQYADHVDKEPSASTALFIDWLTEHTGYEVDETSVKLTRALVGHFQKSDVNQSRLAASRDAKESAKTEKTAAKKTAAKKTPAKKSTAKKAAATKPSTDTGSGKPSVNTPSKRRRRRPQVDSEES